MGTHNLSFNDKSPGTSENDEINDLTHANNLN